MRGVVAADVAIVFAKRYAQHSVHAVFNASVRAYRLAQQRRIARRLDVITALRTAGESAIVLPISRIDFTMTRLCKPVQRWTGSGNQLTSLVTTQRRFSMQP